MVSKMLRIDSQTALAWVVAIATAKARGRKGGKASALAATPEQRLCRARKAGNTTLGRYGLGYYSSLAKAPRKKNVGV